MESSGALYIVSTPIGNLKDITLRALEILKEVDYIVCENPRFSLKLLNHYNISKKLIQFNQHSSKRILNTILRDLSEGKKIAYITDAGTPSISDPGYELVSLALDRELKVIPIPGPSAFVAAFSVSGFSLKPIIFYGYLSSKAGKRRKTLEEASKIKGVLIFYESSHRIEKFLLDIRDFFMDKRIFIARELTKKFESIYRIYVSEIDDFLEKNRQFFMGEFTIIIENSLK